MAQARKHSAVKRNPVQILPTSRDTGAHGWRLLCLLAGALLLVDAIFLMTLGVFSLGVTLPFGVGVLLVTLGLRWVQIQRWLDQSPVRRKLWRVLWILAALWLCSLLAFWSFLAKTGEDAARAQQLPAALVVLGSGTPNGKASPALAARLDTALAQAARFPDALVVVSGGLDFAERISEGQIMGDYLRAKGLAARRIVQEEKSTSTEENLRFSKALLSQHGVTTEGDVVQVITSDFHTLRAGWIARRAGYAHVNTVGAPTPLYVRYNAWLREYFAVLSGFVLREY